MKLAPPEMLSAAGLNAHHAQVIVWAYQARGLVSNGHALTGRIKAARELVERGFLTKVHEGPIGWTVLLTQQNWDAIQAALSTLPQDKTGA